MGCLPSYREEVIVGGWVARQGLCPTVAKSGAFDTDWILGKSGPFANCWDAGCWSGWFRGHVSRSPLAA